MSRVEIAYGYRNDHAEIRRKRLLFRCWHRGTQEIDLIFVLDCDDTDLFDWVTGHSKPPPVHDHDVMHMLRSSHSGQTKG